MNLEPRHMGSGQESRPWMLGRSCVASGAVGTDIVVREA